MASSPTSTPPTSPSFSFASSSSFSHLSHPSSNASSNTNPNAPLSTLSVSSGSHYTSDDQPDLGAFNLVLREYGYMQPGPRIPAYHSPALNYVPSLPNGSGSGMTETLRGRGGPHVYTDTDVETETRTYMHTQGTTTEMEEGRRSTVWAHEPIAQYLLGSASDEDGIEEESESGTDTDTTSRSVAIETASESASANSHSQFSNSSLDHEQALPLSLHPPDPGSSPERSMTVVDDYTLTMRTQASPLSSLAAPLSPPRLPPERDSGEALRQNFRQAQRSSSLDDGQVSSLPNHEHDNSSVADDYTLTIRTQASPPSSLVISPPLPPPPLQRDPRELLRKLLRPQPPPPTLPELPLPVRELSYTSSSSHISSVSSLSSSSSLSISSSSDVDAEDAESTTPFYHAEPRPSGLEEDLNFTHGHGHLPSSSERDRAQPYASDLESNTDGYPDSVSEAAGVSTGPSLGYLDQALSFLAAERAQLAARRRVGVGVGVANPTNNVDDHILSLTKPNLSHNLSTDMLDNDYEHHDDEDDEEDGYASDEHEPSHPSISSIASIFHSRNSKSKSTPVTPRPRAPSPLSPASAGSPMAGSMTPTRLSELRVGAINILSSSDSPMTSTSTPGRTKGRKRTRPRRKVPVTANPTASGAPPSHGDRPLGVLLCPPEPPPAETLPELPPPFQTLKHARSSPALSTRTLRAHNEEEQEHDLDAPTQRLIALARYLARISPADREALRGVERRLVVEARRRFRTHTTHTKEHGSEEDGEDGEEYLDPRGREPDLHGQGGKRGSGEGHPPVHVFVDHSNILFGLITYLKRHPNLASLPTVTSSLASPSKPLKAKSKSKSNLLKMVNGSTATTTTTDPTSEEVIGAGPSTALKKLKKSLLKEKDTGKDRTNEILVPRILTRPKGMPTTAAVTMIAHSYSSAGGDITMPSTTLTPTSPTSGSQEAHDTQQSPTVPTHPHTTPIPLPSFATALSSPPHPSTFSGVATSPTKASRADLNLNLNTKRARSRPRKARKHGVSLGVGLGAADGKETGEEGAGGEGKEARMGAVELRDDNVSLVTSDDLLLLSLSSGVESGGGASKSGGSKSGDTDGWVDVDVVVGVGNRGFKEGIEDLPSRARRRLRRREERGDEELGKEKGEDERGMDEGYDKGKGKEEEQVQEMELEKEPKPKPRPRARHISHTALALILERGRAVSRRVAVTSSPLYQPMDTLERLGYEVRIFARVPDLGDGMDRTAKLKKRTHTHKRHISGGGTTSGGDASGGGSPGTSPLKPSPFPASTFNTPAAATARVKFREQGVDELLQLKLHQALAAEDEVPPGATIVLATGDGNVGQFNEDGFLGPVRTALKRGWRVELYAWEDGLSRAWAKEFGQKSEWAQNGMFQIIGMEQFAASLVKGGL
ncbi:hypothetical protein H0H87_008783 [Tephrocybe sp. NHM501043]|nr:hypothetical protein H0H87_008783 [Tephrocybe sp. NHM501043]